MPTWRTAVVAVYSPAMLKRKYANAECVCSLFDAFTHYSRKDDHKRLVEFPLIKTTASMKCLKFVLLRLLNFSSMLWASFARVCLQAVGWTGERALCTIWPLQKMIHRNDGTIRWMGTQIAHAKAIRSATQSIHYIARSPSTIRINHR